MDWIVGVAAYCVLLLVFIRSGQFLRSCDETMRKFSLKP